MKILVCGSRDWTDMGAIMRELNEYPSETTIIHGCARGADTIAGLVAYNLGMTIEAYPAQWNNYGKAAGPIRNQQMLDEGKPDLVIAFHPYIRNSKGTADMVRRAQARNIPVKLVER